MKGRHLEERGTGVDYEMLYQP